jgi:hypothetical protein
MSKIKPEFHLFWLVWFSLILYGLNCTYYSFSGTKAGELKTIAILLFENETPEYGLREDLTQGVTNLFLQDNSLKVVNEKIADSVLRGTVTKYERIAYSFDQNQNAKEYKVIITIRVTFEDAKNKKNVWEEENLQGWGIYSADTETEDLGKKQAISKLAQDILNRTVKSW